MNDEPYTDPRIKILGSAILLVVFTVAIGLLVWLALLNSIDNQIEYCHTTRDERPVKDCKGSV